MKLPKLNFKLKLFLFLSLLSILPIILANAFWAKFLNLATIFNIILIFFLLIASFIISKLLTDPLKKIMEGTKLLEKGYFDYKFEAQSDDELEEIAISLNILLHNLKDQQIKNQAQKKSLESDRSNLSTTISHLLDGVIFLDSNRNILIFNKTAEKLTGLNTHEVISKNVATVIKFFEATTELTPDSYAPKTARVLDNTIFKKPSIKVQANNKEFYVNLICNQIISPEDGSIRGFLITLQDIKETRELEAMKLDFVSMAAHELRTPITSIKGYLSVFIEENKDQLGSDQKMFLDRISISTQQLTALVENLLSVAKLERGAYSISVSTIDLVPLIRQTVNEVLIKASYKKIELSFLEPKTLIPKVQADKLKLIEVLSNLLSNAIKYTQVGGKITVWVETDNREVITHVQDNGQGIPKESQAHLFSKFFRANGKLEMQEEGNGLGLYITKSILDLHHGRIWVDSEPGKGSRFSFSIPIAATEKIPDNLTPSIHN